MTSPQNMIKIMTSEYVSGKMNQMVGVYKTGQRVLIEPLSSPGLSPRDPVLEQYTGECGTIIDVYWINTGARNFHVYKVRLENGNNEIVVHGDEIREC